MSVATTTTTTPITTTTTGVSPSPSRARVLTAYSCFQKDSSQRDAVKAELGSEANFGTIAKAMSARWKSFDAAAKQPYEAKAAAAKTSQDAIVATTVVKKAAKKAAKQRTRARSAYNFFMQDEAVRATIKTENPEADFGTISKLIGGKWKSLPEADRTPYVTKSTVERAEVLANKPPKVKGTQKRKRARTAYTLYTIDPEVRGAAKTANPDAKMVELTKILAAQWKLLTAEQRTKYAEASQQEKEAVATQTVEQQGTKRRRVRNPYNFYLMDKSIREAIKAEHPTASFGDVSKMVGGKWKAMTDEERAPYVASSNKEREESVQVKVTPVKKKVRIKSAYTRYASDKAVRSAVKEANPEAEFGEISKIIGAQWKALDAPVKKPYEEAVAKERAEFAATQPPKKPKRARSAYLRFSLAPEIRDVVKAANPGLGVAGLAKILGAQWKALSLDDRVPYVTAYEAEKASLLAASA